MKLFIPVACEVVQLLTTGRVVMLWTQGAA